MATTTLPYSVTEFPNRSGTISYRVSGSWNGERIRKNFNDRALAEAYCNSNNAEALKKAIASAPLRLVETRLADDDLRATEAATDRIAGRWPLRDVFAAGILSLESQMPAQSVAALAEEWLALIDGQVSARWLADLRHRVRTFVSAHPDLQTNKFDRALVRRWLDELPLAQQSKANMRNAVHRFGGWLVERGMLRENPAGEIRIVRRRSGAIQGDQPLPTVFTPRQAEALLRACELGACRRLLGWTAATLFTGVRPDSEAPRLTWAEMNLTTAEMTVMGRKRGAKPRIIKLSATALAWMKVAKADALERPALYSRRAKERAIGLANEWLATHAPAEKPIVWDEDITRHTFASYRSPQIPVHDLAVEMGNSPSTIYAHYRHPRPAAEVKAFWSLRPTK